MLEGVRGKNSVLIVVAAVKGRVVEFSSSSGCGTNSTSGVSSARESVVLSRSSN